MKVERYSICWVDLNPVIGAFPSEATRPGAKRTGPISKMRPGVVVSDDLMNKFLQKVVVCPLTTKLHPGWRSRIVIDCAGQASEIAVDQIRTVSKLRLREEIDKLTDDHAAQLRNLIVEMYGLA